MTSRYAIYFAPPEGSDLETFGRRFLGRDHITGQDMDQPEVDGLGAEDLRRMTKSARHYGFHATLKAPFVLKDGCTSDDLQTAAETFAAERAPFETPPLKVSALSRWVAFTLSATCPEMDRLAADCVRDFEPYRATSSQADIARRRKSGLTPRQDEQMLAYGYPFIFEDFHFHMTLAGPLEPEAKETILETLRPLTSTIETMPLHVDAIAVYQQPDRESSFIRTARFPFRPS